MTDQTNQPKRPYTAEKVRERIHELMDYPNQPLITVGMKGAITGWMNAIFSGDDENGNAVRHTVLGWLFAKPDEPFKPMSSKELQNRHWFALDSWLKMERITGENDKAYWVPCIPARMEALYVKFTAVDQLEKQERRLMYELGEDEPI